MDLTQLFTGLNFDGQYLDIAGPGLSGRKGLTTDFALNFALDFALDFTLDGFPSSRWRP